MEAVPTLLAVRPSADFRRIKEYGFARGVDLTPTEAADLQRSGKVDVLPSVGEPGRWDVRARQFVGLIRAGSKTLWIDTKIPIGNVMYILSYAKDLSGWSPYVAGFERENYLVGAVVHGFVARAAAALRPSLLQGYVTVDEAGTGIKGRIRAAPQVSRRYGLPIPVEITFDEFTSDIPENRVIKAAATRLLLVGGIAKPLTARLRELQMVLREVGDLDVVSRRRIVYTRLNARYRDAIRLANLILDEASIRYREGAVSAASFLLDMNRAFEDFVTEVAKRTSQGSGLTFRPQHSRWLDTENRMAFRPDLSWWIGNRCVAVADVKYKSASEDQVPAGDIYQMVAYCLVHQLDHGTLIYAQGEAAPREYQIRESGITVVVRTVDLSGDAREMRRGCEQLIRSLVGAAHG